MSKQLELFEVLRAKQEQQKSDELNRIIKIHKDKRLLTQRKKNILLGNGFEEGTHFMVKENIEMSNVDYSIGYSYDDTRKSFTDKIKVYNGGCYLIVKEFSERSNLIESKNATFDLENGKLNCYSLQNYSSRFIKPTTMFSKLIGIGVVVFLIHKSVSIGGDQLSFFFYLWCGVYTGSTTGRFIYLHLCNLCL